MEEILILTALGLVLGFVSSFLGIGGGSLTVPILFSLYPHMPPQVIIVISLGSIFISTSFNSFQFAKLGLLPPKKILVVFFISCLLGSIGGSQLLLILEPEWIKKILAGTLIIITIRLALKRKSQYTADPQLKSGWLFAIGLGGSLLSSLTGLGGGIIFTPAFISIIKLPIKQVSPYANFAMACATGLGLVPHLFVPYEPRDGFEMDWLNSLFLGNVNVVVIVLLGLSALVSSRFGIKLNNNFKDQYKRLILAVMLFLLSIKLILQA